MRLPWSVEVGGSLEQFLTVNRVLQFSGILEWILTLNFRVEILEFWTSNKTAGKGVRGLKPKVFKGKSVMGRRMELVSEPGSDPEFQDRDLVS